MKRKHLRRLTGLIILILIFAGIYYAVEIYPDGKTDLAIVEYDIKEKIYTNEKFDIYFEIENKGNQDIDTPLEIIWYPDINRKYYNVKIDIDKKILKGQTKAFPLQNIDAKKFQELKGKKLTSKIEVFSAGKEKNKEDNAREKPLEFSEVSPTNVPLKYRIKNNGKILLTYRTLERTYSQKYHNQKGKIVSLPSNTIESSIKEHKQTILISPRFEIMPSKVLKENIRINDKKIKQSGS